MTQIRPDTVILASMIDTYKNYDTLKGTINISGTIANGATANFSTTIPYSRGKTRADLYAQNLTSGEKRPVSGGSRQTPYSTVSSEVCTQLATYSGTEITVTFSIFNGTGSSINLTAQDIEITAVLYEVPYSQ